MLLAFYLINDADEYRDAAFHEEEPPYTAPDGWEWVEGVPEGLIPWVEKDQGMLLLEAFQVAMADMQVNYQSLLTGELLSNFFDLQAKVAKAYESGEAIGNTVAEYAITNIDLPEELEDYRADLLAILS